MEHYKSGLDRHMLGRRLNAIRKYKGISSESLSEMIGKSSGGYIRMIESAQNGISIDALVDICNALDISPDYLLADSLRHSYDFLEKVQRLHPSQISVIYRMIDAMIAENEHEGSTANHIE